MQVGEKILSQQSRNTMTFYWLKSRALTDHVSLKSRAAYAHAGRLVRERPTLCVSMEISEKPEKCRIVAQDLLFLPLPSSPCECVKSFFPRWINVMSECGRGRRVSRVVRGRGGRMDVKARQSQAGRVHVGVWLHMFPYLPVSDILSC